MAEGKKKEDVQGRLENYSEGRRREDSPRGFFFHWILYFSVSAVMILAVGIFFQMQLTALRQELASLKVNCEEEKSRNLRKRSSREAEEEEGREKGGIESAHLQGTFPFQHVEKQGKIGPWSTTATHNSFISLKNKNTEIEISHGGIYFVYAQVYYLTSEPHNSFQILSYNGTEERRHHRSLASCSSQGRSFMGDVSCFTGFTGSLHPGQRLYLNQIEQNRVIHFANGCSFFGVVLLRKTGAFNNSI